jgi:hypothetical protein
MSIGGATGGGSEEGEGGEREGRGGSNAAEEGRVEDAAEDATPQ